MPVATKGVVPAIRMMEFVGVTVIDCNVVAGVTINVAVPDLPAVVLDAAVIVTVPAFLPVATPVDKSPVPVANTSATELSLELHVTSLLGIVELVPSE